MESWRYKRNGATKGPVSKDQLRSLCDAGEITGETLVWTSSFGAEWKRYADVDELQRPGAPPPLQLEKVNNFWAWLTFGIPKPVKTFWVWFAFGVPIVCGLINVLVRRSTGNDFVISYSSWLSRLPVAVMLLASALWALLGVIAIKKSGQKNAVAGMLLWMLGALFYMSWCWWTAALASNFMSVLMGFELPECNADVVQGQVRELFGKAAATGNAGVAAVGLTDTQQQLANDQLRICTVKVLATNARTYSVRYKLEARGTGLFRNTIEGVAVTVFLE